MIKLTEVELTFLEKTDKERKQHADAQKKYRNRKAQMTQNIKKN
jgi:hypothetical protein